MWDWLFVRGLLIIIVFWRVNVGLEYCGLGDEWVWGFGKVMCDVVGGGYFRCCWWFVGRFLMWGILGDVWKVDVMLGMVLGFVMFSDKVSVFMIGDIVVFCFFKLMNEDCIFRSFLLFVWCGFFFCLFCIWNIVIVDEKLWYYYFIYVIFEIWFYIFIFCFLLNVGIYLFIVFYNLFLKLYSSFRCF